jgi:hypothetical protein
MFSVRRQRLIISLVIHTLSFINCHKACDSCNFQTINVISVCKINAETGQARGRTVEVLRLRVLRWPLLYISKSPRRTSPFASRGSARPVTTTRPCRGRSRRVRDLRPRSFLPAQALRHCVRLPAYLHPLPAGDVGAPRRQPPGPSPASFPSPSASPSLPRWLTVHFPHLQVSLRGSSAREITRDALLQKVSEERQLRSHLRRAAAAALSIQVPPARPPPPNAPLLRLSCVPT